MFMDLDHFKQLNDTLGHDVGDVLLQQVSARLRLCLREGDSVARFGGDEFVVLLDALSSQPQEAAAQTAAIAQKILAALGQTYNLNGPTYDSTLSIGVVVFQGDEPVGTLLKRADLAMYRAKSLGRNQICFFDTSMEAEVLAQETLAEDMRRGLNDQAFVLHYQIQVDSSGTPVGAEALVRWNHARHGLMLPPQFLPMAEETGLIVPLGNWVLQAACQQLLAWARHPQTASWTLSVNVGACQLAQADFAADVARVLKITHAPASQLRLELTEGTLLGDVENVIAKMTTVQATGVGFCLDDFGAGFASLAYLKRLPLVQLKIDQVMVHAVLHDDSVVAIARAIVALGLSMGLPVIAEGVETAAQRDFFADLGCYAFQGNYIGAVALPGAMLDDYVKNEPPVQVEPA
jgi:diguanylate cyclase (GGDEF)-like protein